MSDPSNIKVFPDLSNKLTAPTKRSVFERQKAEAEAKKAREKAETAAVYEDFVKSFENDGNDQPSNPNLTGIARPGFVPGPSGARAPSGPPKRHFAPGGRSSGPGSLASPPNLSRKRALDGSRPQDGENPKGLFAFEDAPFPTADAAAAFQASDDADEKNKEGKDDERVASKPTLQLSSLPPGTSPAVIKSLIPPLLTVDGVRIVPPSGPGGISSTERKTMSAIVTLANETPASDIDTVVSTLQNRYLGWGFNLSISRHLSSAALGALNATTSTLNSSLSSLPFGAKIIAAGPGSSLSRAPPPSDMHRGGFAPPSSYNTAQQGRAQPQAQVKVNPPSDINQLKLIHKTLESLLTHGPEFEALLMSRPEVQREEKWAWIWNPRSPGGVWYRWRLWEILTGASQNKRGGGRFGEPPHRLFDGAALWAEPEEILPFEFSTQLNELISDSDYNSSDEDESGDEAGGARKRRRQFQGVDGPPLDGLLSTAIEEQSYLNPLQKAKLTHLLARLPTSTAKLRKGDVARITAFAISRAGHGTEEVVDMLIDNILRPFAWSAGANPMMNSGLGLATTVASVSTDPNADQRHHRGVQDDLALRTNLDMMDDEDGKPKEASIDKKDSKDDVSTSTLIALHLVSDILSASSTSGVRHAWRYRSLFESALTSRKVFPYLGRLEKVLGWGRLRAEKWRRSVSVVMQLWEGWCVFPAGTQERFMEEFVHPPLTKEEEDAEKEKEKEQVRERVRSKISAKPKWKSVDPNEMAESNSDQVEDEMNLDDALLAESDIDGEALDDVDGDPMEDVDGEPMDDSDGSPMREDTEIPSQAAAKMEADEAVEAAAVATAAAAAVEKETAAAKAKRQRPKAEDMFADSDED